MGHPSLTSGVPACFLDPVAADDPDPLAPRAGGIVAAVSLLLAALRALTGAPPPTSLDPVVKNPGHYTVMFENDQVRVLKYSDQPGDRTTPHDHPDSVMCTLTAFRRRLVSGDVTRDVELAAGAVVWLPARQHCGENIGDAPTHVIFVELKPDEQFANTDDPSAAVLGPQ